MVHKSGDGIVFGLVRRLGARRAGVAMIIALSAPLLIAGTGLSVDVGYWYEQQESLQSAADAAAIAAATADLKYSVTSGTAAEPFALAAANNATNGQFGLTSAAVILTPNSSTAPTSWQASIKIPRGSFFSRVKGLGLPGVPTGTQSASASAAVVQASGSGGCLLTADDIDVTGGAVIKATNCGVVSNDTSCPSMTVSGSGMIVGTSVSTAANCVATAGGSQTTSTTRGSGYIGTAETGTPDNGSTNTVTLNAGQASDPLAGMNSGNVELWNPGWTVPTAPTETRTLEDGGSVTGSPSNPTSSSLANIGECDTGSTPSGACVLKQNYLDDLANLGLSSLTFLAGTGANTNTDIVGGGLGGQVNGPLALQDSTYFINGINISMGGAFTVGSSGQTVPETFVVNNGMTVGNAGSPSMALASGTYYLTGPATGSTVTGYALSDSALTTSFGGGSYFVNGGVDLTGNITTLTLASGIYEFTAFSGNSNAPSGTGKKSSSGGGAFEATEGSNITIGTTPSGSGAPAPATYYFDGGLNITNGASNITLNPGIYYIRNGNLVISAGATVTGTDVTFVLEGTAGFVFNGGATVNISAPSSNCVSPASYPDPSDESAPYYDGTDGEGICGIAIYQARGDTTADTVDEGAGSTFNGGIYAPDAPLTISGAGALNITTTNVPDLEVQSINDSGSGDITLTENTSSGQPSGAASSSVMLVQ
jgi:Flp pilus assembly protein TadG